jgi:hypothetical protein
LFSSLLVLQHANQRPQHRRSTSDSDTETTTAACTLAFSRRTAERQLRSRTGGARPPHYCNAVTAWITINAGDSISAASAIGARTAVTTATANVAAVSKSLVCVMAVMMEERCVGRIAKSARRVTGETQGRKKAPPKVKIR